MDDYIGTAEAGRLLGVQYQTVIKLILAGTIIGEKRGNRWVIERNEFEHYRDMRRPLYHPSNYKGGVIANGYRRVYINGKYTMEHRYLMEQRLGRKLTDMEQVHHKDGNRSNNDFSNLEVKPSQRAHSDEHSHFRSDTHKQCSRCEEIKPRAEFYKRHKQSVNSDDNVSRCIACYRESRLEH